MPLALFDYLRKSHVAGFVVSLSGGADSSAVTMLVQLMVATRRSRTRSFDEFADKLCRSIRESRRKPTTPASDRVGQLLTCVYQATRNSGETTRDAAETVADAVGAEFLEWNVDALVDGYVATVSQATGRELTWDRDDVALQNIQARARGPGVVAAGQSSRRAAAGHQQPQRSGRRLRHDGRRHLRRARPDRRHRQGVPARLAQVDGNDRPGRRRPATGARSRQQPDSRPPSSGPPPADQTDEGDLMPYRVLDAIERAAIRDKLMPVEVFETMRPQFPQYEPQQLGAWVERFFQLWCRNQWKRERYAPSFHVDDENLDPKTWCRFPILNSGFEKELRGAARVRGDKLDEVAVWISTRMSQNDSG